MSLQVNLLSYLALSSSNSMMSELIQASPFLVLILLSSYSRYLCYLCCSFYAPILGLPLLRFIVTAFPAYFATSFWVICDWVAFSGDIVLDPSAFLHARSASNAGCCSFYYSFIWLECAMCYWRVYSCSGSIF